MNQDLTLLSDGQIWGNDSEQQLDIMKTYGTKCASTDLAILTGCWQCDETVNEDNSLAGRATEYWTKTEEILHPMIHGTLTDFSGAVCTCFVDGDRNCSKEQERTCAIRPVLQSSIIYSQISPNKVRGYNGTYEVEYGEYPQMAAEVGYQVALENELQSGNLKKTGRNYTFDSRGYDDYDLGFDPKTHEEYEYQSKKYIRVKANSIYRGNKFQLSNGEEYRDGDYVWIEVSPVKWLIDERKGILISKKGLVSGIRYAKRYTFYKGDFDKTDMKEYLNNYMSRDLFQSSVLVDTNSMLPGEKTKKVEATEKNDGLLISQTCLSNLIEYLEQEVEKDKPVWYGDGNYHQTNIYDGELRLLSKIKDLQEKAFGMTPDECYESYKKSQEVQPKKLVKTKNI